MRIVGQAKKSESYLHVTTFLSPSAQFTPSVNSGQALSNAEWARNLRSFDYAQDVILLVYRITLFFVGYCA